MSEATEIRRCPKCAQTLEPIVGYVTWCPNCDWNVDPTAPDDLRGRLARRARARAQVRGQRLFEQINRDRALRSRWDANRVTTVAAAVVVHSFTLLLIGGALWVAWWSGPSPTGVLLAAGLLALAWTVGPRFGRLPRGARALGRSDLPSLYELLDRVVAATGGRLPHVVVVSNAINASWGTLGLRRRRVLTIGAPLWAAATPSQQLALLGHEIAHEVNGDVTHTLIVATAIRSLAEWRAALLGGIRPGPLGSGGGTIRDLMLLLLAVAGAVPLGIQRVVEGARFRSSQRAEYIADELAATVAGTSGACGLMELLLLSSSIGLVIDRAMRTGESDPIRYLRAQLARVPPSERERLRRVAARRGHRVDETHPPTHLRWAFVTGLEPTKGTVELSEYQAAAIDGEILGQLGAGLRIAR